MKLMKFDDEAMNREFAAKLKMCDIPFTQATDGQVSFDSEDWPAINSIAHQIRDALFQWDFVKWDEDAQSQCFREALERASLRYEVQYCDSKPWFILPVSDKAMHNSIAMDVV